jgi:hypothetical protein
MCSINCGPVLNHLQLLPKCLQIVVKQNIVNKKLTKIYNIEINEMDVELP